MPLVCSRGEVRDHRGALAAALRAILPAQGGQVVARVSGDDLEADLRLSGTDQEYAGRRGLPTPVVPMLEATPDSPSRFWLAWHEGWRAPQPMTGRRAPRKGSIQFRTSSVSVYVGDPGAPKRQVIRGEWAGAEVSSATGRPAFQGNGAAHPHWHYAGLDADDKDGGGLSALAASTFGAEAGVVDFEPDAPAPQVARAARGSDAAWAGVHLAASARWAQLEWLGPRGPDAAHAFDPADCAEIRRWIVSCVRYLQSELQGQLVRSR